MSNTHPLRTIRDLIGLTQKALAEVLGVSKVLVEKVEYGKLAVSEDLGRRIRVRLGCVVREEADAQGRQVVVVAPVAAETGRAYTRVDFERHTARYRNTTDPEAALWIDGALEIARLLFRAGARAGKAPQVSGEFEQFVLKVMKDYDLGKSWWETLREEPSRPGKAEQVRRIMEASPIEAGLEILGLDPHRPRRRP